MATRTTITTRDNGRTAAIDGKQRLPLQTAGRALTAKKWVETAVVTEGGIYGCCGQVNRSRGPMTCRFYGSWAPKFGPGAGQLNVEVTQMQTKRWWTCGMACAAVRLSRTSNRHELRPCIHAPVSSGSPLPLCGHFRFVCL